MNSLFRSYPPHFFHLISLLFLLVFAIFPGAAFAEDTITASHSASMGTCHLKITNAIEYTGTLAAFGMTVNLPNGWSYASGNGDTPPDYVKVLDTGDLEMIWLPVPDSPVKFTYTVTAPGMENSIQGSISSRVLYRRFSGGERVGQVLPDPLNVTLSPTTLGDINCDDHITLADAIIVLKTIAGMDTSEHILTSAFDMNGDERMGTTEAICILQKIAE